MVADQGRGISKEELPKIFDPYFSKKTRGSSKGMGLGLTIASFIISQHEGCMEADSKAGQGMTLYMDIPAAA
jgi:K+-sensing histidine kinase KdpD